MKLNELKVELGKNPDGNVRFQLPSGERIAPHAHVTEVALIEKKFVDCGGTFRNESMCRMQTWVAEDVEHRLTAGTLLKILNKAAAFLQTEEICVDVEHELDYITQFPLERVERAGDEVVLRLELRHTDCLAREKCCPPSALTMPNPLKFQFTR